MKMSLLLIVLTAFFVAGCAEEQPAAPVKTKTAKRPTPTPTPAGFRAVEKPQSYSQ
jgi:PBP1b-binding outer membrane lipoprotein LpoB